MGLIAAAALVLTGCTGDVIANGSAETKTVSDASAKRIDAAIEQAMQLSGSTEAVVGVWGTGDKAYVRGYGEGVDANTKIRGAQATLPVMCAALLDLVDAGELTLDREVSKDLTRQPGIEGVTYGQLCDMKSGLGDFKANFKTVNTNNPTRLFPDQELLAQGFAASPTSWPGLDVHPSDTNLVLLSRALKVKLRTDLPTVLKEHVFSKAGMGSSYYPEMGENTISGNTLKGLTYPIVGGKISCEVEKPNSVPEVSPSMLSGAGATVTTVTDLKNFHSKYMSGAFGGKSAKVVNELSPLKNPERDAEGNPTAELDTAGNQWGFGTEKIGALYGNAGSITGTLTASYTDPSTGYSVVVSLNNSSAGTGFVKALALELAALSAEEGFGPEVTWTVDSQVEQLTKGAICQ